MAAWWPFWILTVASFFNSLEVTNFIRLTSNFDNVCNQYSSDEFEINKNLIKNGRPVAILNFDRYILVNPLEATIFNRLTSNLDILCMTYKTWMSLNLISIRIKMADSWPFRILTGSPPRGR